MANHEKEISVAERQLYILSLLSQNPIGYTAEEIVEKLKKWEVVLTKRTIQRDIDELSMSYAIEEEERDGRTYFKARKFSVLLQYHSHLTMQRLRQRYVVRVLGSTTCSLTPFIRMVRSTSRRSSRHSKRALTIAMLFVVWACRCSCPVNLRT